MIIVDPISYLYLCMLNIFCNIICHYYFQVMIISSIAGFQIQMIPLQWYIDNQKNENITVKTCCFINQKFFKHNTYFKSFNCFYNYYHYFMLRSKKEIQIWKSVKTYA